MLTNSRDGMRSLPFGKEGRVPAAYRGSPGRAQLRGWAPRESRFVLQFLLEAGADLEVAAARW